MNTKEAIRVIEKKIKFIDEVLDTKDYIMEHDKPKLKKFREIKQALQHLITIAKAVESAEAELPPKRKLDKRFDWTFSNQIGQRTNKLHDIASKIIAKDRVRIKELEKALYCARANYNDLRSDFKQDEELIAELQAKLDKVKGIDWETFSAVYSVTPKSLEQAITKAIKEAVE